MLDVEVDLSVSFSLAENNRALKLPRLKYGDNAVVSGTNEVGSVLGFSKVATLFFCAKNSSILFIASFSPAMNHVVFSSGI